MAAMETAGIADTHEDAERKGLGTPATRAGIIEKLVRTGFVERKKKLLISTDKGTNLIAVLPDEIKSPLLTAEWEQKLKEVERGELAGAAFMKGITALAQGLVACHTAPLPQYASLFASGPKALLWAHAPAAARRWWRARRAFSVPAGPVSLRSGEIPTSGRPKRKNWTRRLPPRFSLRAASFFRI